MIGQVIFVIIYVLVLFIVFGLGHGAGYYKGRTDQIEEFKELEREVK